MSAQAAGRAVKRMRASADLGAPGESVVRDFTKPLPALAGRPIAVRIRRSLGPHLASASIPRRRILLDAEVFASPGEFERILIHELFHFVWVRFSNARRRDWEGVLACELARRAQGELGWSAEWRKAKLAPSDARLRTARWRRYVCESFCDTAAWRFAGLRAHGEFTLAAPFRRLRRQWLERNLAPGPLAI
jgi:hypothetical protein